jgi:dephospho-CoA kinase
MDLPRPKLLVGLTGGMGCGKSTATGMFAALGFSVIDSDRVVREEILRDAEIVAAIGGRFGAAVVGPDGVLDRRAVGRRVFADPVDRRWLEDLIHPRVRAAWRREISRDRSGRWIIEVPLLFESGLENWFDFTICVASSYALQLSRLSSRGIPVDLAEQRIAIQLPLPRKIAAADHVLLNDGSFDFLREQVAWLVHRLSKAIPP